MSRYYHKQHYTKHRRYKPKGAKVNPFSKRQYQAVIKKFKYGLLVGIGLIILTLYLLRSCGSQPNYPVKLPEALPKPHEKWI